MKCLIMKKFFLFMLPLAVAVGCDDDDPGTGPVPSTPTDFTIRIENVTAANPFFSSGSVNGLLMPGAEQEFMFEAGPVTLPGAVTKLSLVTMFVQSNDLFFAPGEAGITLYENGARVTGDVTDQIDLWDAGTEVNEEPGVGPNQAPRQGPANTGDDENGTVILVDDSGDGFTYPAVSDVIQVEIEALPGSDTGFKVIVRNISDGSALPTPFAGLSWVVHTADAPYFTVGEADRGEGLESIAEDGDETSLVTYQDDNTGLITPLSPGVWAVHDDGVNPLFTSGTADLGEGLEAIAEDGEPGALATVLNGKTGVSSSALFNTPAGATAPGPAIPGGAYEFTVTAEAGDYLSFATMFVQSNDLFYTFAEGGIPLFNNGAAVSGDMTTSVLLYDAGTEVNEFPGAGLNQVIRQGALNTGTDEGGVVTNINNISDGFTYPDIANVIQVTITPQQ